MSTTPDDLYRDGCRNVPDTVMIRFAELVLDRCAAESLESDDGPRSVLAMLRRGETLSAARLGKRLHDGALRVPRKQRSAWHYAVAVAHHTATILHNRRSTSYDAEREALDAAGSVFWYLNSDWRGVGSGRTAHDYARTILADLCNAHAE